MCRKSMWCWFVTAQEFSMVVLYISRSFQWLFFTFQEVLMVITLIFFFPYLFAIASLFKNNNLCMSLFLKTISQMKLLVLCVRGPDTPFATSFFCSKCSFCWCCFWSKETLCCYYFSQFRENFYCCSCS